MLIAIIGVGSYLSVRLAFLPLRRLALTLSLLLRNKAGKDDDGDISPFASLTTALSATVGTGNIAGVATAIAVGGPGAVFWMWVSALVGMSTKYAEAVLAVRYRRKDENGDHHGGPMYFIRYGLPPHWRWLATAFAIFGSVAAFGIGNTVQSNTLAHALDSQFGISPLLTGIVLFAVVYAVVIGGVKRIGSFASKVVPLMSLIYLLLGIVVVALNYERVPDAFGIIFAGAFGDIEPVAGGVAGYTLAQAIRFGVARGVFSNEAGLGSASIAHACSKTRKPIHQGLIASLGTVIDTIIICGITALIILTSKHWQLHIEGGQELYTGAALTLHSVNATVGDFGGVLVTVAMAFFGFTTIIGWGMYGEKCVGYLFGSRSAIPFRHLWSFSCPLGALVLLTGAHTPTSINVIWLVSDILNACMALPNLIALVLLSPVILSMTRAHFQGTGGESPEPPADQRQQA